MEVYKQRVEIRNARFFAHHGYYEEEQMVGHDFVVSVCCQFSTHSLDKEDLEQTLNYERLYSIVQAQMAIPRKLLETVAYAIMKELKQTSSLAEEISVELCKVNPPFGGDYAEAVISVSWKKHSSGS